MSVVLKIKLETTSISSLSLPYSKYMCRGCRAASICRVFLECIRRKPYAIELDGRIIIQMNDYRNTLGCTLYQPKFGTLCKLSSRS